MKIFLLFIPFLISLSVRSQVLVVNVSLPEPCINETLASTETTVSYGFKIYPNPSDGIVYLEIHPSLIDEKSKIQVFDFSGKNMLSKKLSEYKTSDKYQLDLSFLSQGVYMVSFDSKSQRISKKLIIK